jgi:hypothetical protein
MRGARPLILIALGLMGTWVTAPTVSAGSYTVGACSPRTSSGIFMPVNFPEGLVVANRCGGPAIGPIAFEGPTDEGALSAEDSTNTTANIPDGAQAGWLAVAPLGTEITAITYYRSLHAYNQQSLVPGLWTAEGNALETCVSPHEGNHECNNLNNQVPVSFSGLNTASLFFGVRCHLVEGDEYCIPAAPGTRHAEADIYSATVTLSEASSPELRSVSGASWNGGIVSGQTPLAVTADDFSGIAAIEVRSNLGGVLATISDPCDYYEAVPCPDLTAAPIQLNTANTTDGPQRLLVTAQNAAGNLTTVVSPPIAIDNHGPAAVTNLAASTSGEEVSLTWANPPSTPVPLASAAVYLCTATCTLEGSALASGMARIATPSPGSYTVQVTLTDAAGRTSPVASTPLLVPAPAPGPKETPKPIRPKLYALIDHRGRLYVAGQPRGVFEGRVRVCWRSVQHGHVLGHRCTQLHVEHSRVAVTFHPTQRARRGRITVTITRGSKVIATLTASRATK